MAIEVNTAGIRRGLGSVYPDPGFLAACVAEKVPVTLGSDAHTPGDVGRDYAAAFRLLGDLGITEVALYERRRLASRPLGALARQSLTHQAAGGILIHYNGVEHSKIRVSRAANRDERRKKGDWPPSA